MSLATVVSLGYGTWGSIPAVTGLGYLAATFVEPPVSPDPSGPYLGGGGVAQPMLGDHRKIDYVGHGRYFSPGMKRGLWQPIDILQTLSAPLSSGRGIPGWWGGGFSLLPGVTQRGRASTPYGSGGLEVTLDA